MIAFSARLLPRDYTMTNQHLVQDDNENDLEEQVEGSESHEEVNQEIDDASTSEVKTDPKSNEVENESKDFNNYSLASDLSTESNQDESTEEHLITVNKQELETLKTYRNICFNIRDTLEKIKNNQKVGKTFLVKYFFGEFRTLDHTST